jgi:hypothetical protein
MQTYDNVQAASIQRSRDYLRYKEYKALADFENRRDLVMSLSLLALFAVSVAGLVAFALGV